MSKSQAKNLIDGSNADHLHTHNYSEGVDIVGEVFIAYQNDIGEAETGTYSVKTMIKNPRFVEFMVTFGECQCKSVNYTYSYYKTYQIIYSFKDNNYIIKNKWYTDSRAVHTIHIYNGKRRSSDFANCYLEASWVNGNNDLTQICYENCNLSNITFEGQSILVNYKIHTSKSTCKKGAIAISPFIIY